MSRSAQPSSTSRPLLPGWLVVLSSMVPGSLLTWLMFVHPSNYDYLLGAAATLFLAGLVLITQWRTRWIGLGLILGFATWFFTTVVPGFLLTLFVAVLIMSAH